jgi:hypothetical protein
MINKTKLLAAVFTLATIFGLCGFVTVNQAQAQQTNALPKIRMVSPKMGDVFKPGQKITIVWDVQIPPTIDLAWCEQEIFLSLDGGKTIKYRVTQRLSPDVRTFDWTVPNLPTDKAVLDVRFGSEKEFGRFEVSKPQKRAKFRIANATNNFEQITLQTQPTSELLAGEELSLNWQSSVTDVDFYEVQVSYDQGAHFHTIGKTAGTTFSWQVPTEVSGFASFQIVAQKLDGARIASIVEAQPQALIRSRQ